MPNHCSHRISIIGFYEMIAIRSITYSSWRDITRRKHATDDPGAGRARDNLNIVSGALSGDLELYCTVLYCTVLYCTVLHSPGTWSWRLIVMIS